MKAAHFDLEYEILREHSKRQVLRIRDWIGRDRRRFAQLMELFLKGEYRVTQRSVWSIGHCLDRHPALIEGWMPAMIAKMGEKGVHDAVPRNVLRILEHVDIPRSVLGNVVSMCFRYLNDPKVPIAIKANAMTVLGNAARKEPGLIYEIEESIAHISVLTGAINARARKVLKMLRRVKEHSNEGRARSEQK